MGYVHKLKRKTGIILLFITRFAFVFTSNTQLLFVLFFNFKEKASATRLHFLELKNKEGEDVINMNTYKRCQKCIEFMHTAAATASLDPVTRADIAIRCVLICWKGLWVSCNERKQGNGNIFERQTRTQESILTCVIYICHSNDSQQ